MAAAAAAPKKVGVPSPFSPAEQALAADFLRFVNANPSQFHVVASVALELRAAGFTQVSEKEAEWGVLPLGRYFYTRNQSSIVAFAVGGKWRPGNGFTIVAAHTDSPVLKIKPISKVEKQGFLEVGVEPYGGGLWHTWFDRDLAVAGRVIVAKPEGGFESRLVHINRAVMRVPTLAIHLTVDADKGFNPNKQQHLLPIIATAVANQLGTKGQAASSANKEDLASAPFEDLHHSVLIQLVAEELGVDVKDVRDFELCLCDATPATLGGAYNEFIFSRALDNQMMTFIAMKSLIASSREDKQIADETQIRVIALFDNEEVGSASIQGAGNNNLYQLLNRLNAQPSSFDAAIARSFLVSADMAHGVHPNYADMHEEFHRPGLHKGLVIKQNANQRYATSGYSAFVLNEIARRHNLPTQKFVIRNDGSCGSTIGPILATGTGIRTVDVGVPQLSMHSIREMCGIADVHSAYLLLQAFYTDFAALDKSISTSDYKSTWEFIGMDD